MVPGGSSRGLSGILLTRHHALRAANAYTFPPPSAPRDSFDKTSNKRVSASARIAECSIASQHSSASPISVMAVQMATTWSSVKVLCIAVPLSSRPTAGKRAHLLHSESKWRHSLRKRSTQPDQRSANWVRAGLRQVRKDLARINSLLHLSSFSNHSVSQSTSKFSKNQSPQLDGNGSIDLVFGSVSAALKSTDPAS